MGEREVVGILLEESLDLVVERRILCIILYIKVETQPADFKPNSQKYK